ncbi:MAG: lysylphosphatidylglycerol synthase transmembrane domain-containing protein [Anaerolineaceae bacterium]
MSSSPRWHWKSLLRWLPGVLISAIALYAVIQFVHIQDFKQAFSTARWQFICVVVLILGTSMLVRAKAWQTILGNKITWKQAFFGISEGYLLNNIFPFRAGEIGRSIFVGKASGLGTFHVLSSIVIERAFDLAIAAILVLVTLPLVVGLAWVKTAALVALVIVIISLLALFLIAINRDKVVSWVEKISQRRPFIIKYILPQLNKLLDGLSTLTHPGQFALSFFWIALSWGMWIYMYDILVWQIIPAAPLWNGAFVGSLLSLGVAIPSAPAALGVYEASMVAAIVLIGGSESAGLAYAILLHVLQFIISAVFGIWGLIRDGQNFASILSTLNMNQNPKQLEVEETKN